MKGRQAQQATTKASRIRSTPKAPRHTRAPAQTPCGIEGVRSSDMEAHQNNKIEKTDAATPKGVRSG